LTDEPYLSDSRYDMFKGVKSEDDVRKIFSNLNTIELLGLKLPSHIRDDYIFVWQEAIKERMGLVEYDDIRESVLADWGGSNSLEKKLDALKEDTISQLDSLDEQIQDMYNKIDNIEKIFKKLMIVIGDKKIPITIKDYVGDLDAEDNI
jgi:hypothetical protein